MLILFVVEHCVCVCECVFTCQLGKDCAHWEMHRGGKLIPETTIAEVLENFN